MARTTAPLLGFNATGQIAKTMVYGTWRGVKYARRYVIPGNPQTAAQQTTRTTFATLREMWKLMPAIGRAPWTAFATGRPFLNLNAFIGENMRVVRGDANFQDYLGSPGARGGLPPLTVVGSTGTGSGEVDVTFTTPSVPSGWTLDNVQAIAFEDQDPSVDFAGNLVAGEDPTGPVVLAGLTPATLCVVAGWLEWTKPNGQKAYSVSLGDTATSQT